jgi:hypothetical protein
MEAMTSEGPRVLGEATLAELRTRMLWLGDRSG